MTNSGPQLWVNGALEMSPNISYQPLSTARFASLTLPLYMNGNSFKLVNSSPSSQFLRKSCQRYGLPITPSITIPFHSIFIDISAIII